MPIAGGHPLPYLKHDCQRDCHGYGHFEERRHQRLAAHAYDDGDGVPSDEVAGLREGRVRRGVQEDCAMQARVEHAGRPCSP